MLIKKIIRRLNKIVKSRYKLVILRFRATRSFLRDLKAFNRQNSKSADNNFPLISYYPLIFDKYKDSGHFTTHYFEQDLLMAQCIFKNQPLKHVDIGSRVDGFVTHVASFREIEILDIRPIDRPITNVSFRQADLMKLPDDLINYTDSISSLHVIEHFGLGRYGDPIDVNGHLKALENIYLMLKTGGKFYFSVPVGKQGVYFNAHRLFAVDFLVKLLEEKYKIDHFFLIDDEDKLHREIDIYSAKASTSFGCTFGCALFELTKL